MWNVIHVIVPPGVVGRRKHGFAHLSAVRTSKNLNPTIAVHSEYGAADRYSFQSRGLNSQSPLELPPLA